MMPLKFYNCLSTSQTIKIITMFSAVIACWLMYIQQGWINDDSVLYFEAARLFSIGDWYAGWKLFSWPLYSLLIAGLHSVSRLNFQASAQILTASFFMLSTYSYLRIILLAGGSKITIICGALLLFSTTYIVGDILPMLLRDQGFWACFLTALMFFIQYYRWHRLKDALYWQIFAILALLFRIETATYISLLPLILLLSPDTTIKNKIIYFIEAHTLNLTILVLAGIAMVLYGDLSSERLGRLQEILSIWSGIQENLSNTIATKVDTLATSVLGEPLKSYAWMSFVLTLIAIATAKSVSVAGWLPVILIPAYYTKLKENMAEDVRLILWATALLAFFNAMLIILKVNLLSSRYVIAFGFVMLIFSAFALHEALKQWKLVPKKQDKAVLVIVTITISLSLISNVLPKNIGYNHEQEAVFYMKQQGIPNNQIFFVSPRSRYFAGAPYNGRGYDYWEYTKQSIEDGSVLNHQYLMIPLKINSDITDRESFISEKLPQFQKVKTFYDARNKKKVIIYKKN